MKEIFNKVNLTGELVKMGLVEKVTSKGADSIMGSLVLRTADSSEHEVSFFTFKYKKDANGNFTSELTSNYEKWSTFMGIARDMAHPSVVSGEERPTIVNIGRLTFDGNDFLNQNNEVVSAVKLSGQFINVVEPKDYETTVLEAKFEVEGIIEKITDVIKDGTPTGELSVEMSVIRQRGLKQNGQYVKDQYEPTSLFPLTLTVGADMAHGFRSAGYYESCFAKLNGVLINKAEEKTITEQVAFGEPVTHVVKRIERKRLIKSGSTPTDITTKGLTNEDIQQLRNQRKTHLAEVKAGNANAPQDGTFGKASGVAVASNPFQQAGASTPFANPFQQ